MLTNKNVLNVRLTIIPLNPNLTLLKLDHNSNYVITLYIQYYLCIYILSYYQSENHNNINLVTCSNLTILRKTYIISCKL